MNGPAQEPQLQDEEVVPPTRWEVELEVSSCYY